VYGVGRRSLPRDFPQASGTRHRDVRETAELRPCTAIRREKPPPQG
jgi:hypothetical protein